jgi:hypothetical protein
VTDVTENDGNGIRCRQRHFFKKDRWLSVLDDGMTANPDYYQHPGAPQ